MGSVAGDDVASVGGGGNEERILVSVRLRPLNEREVERNDASDWECISNNTIIFKNTIPGAMSPSAHTFDRVFGSDSSTKQVYEEGAKEVALSVVSGINSSIFAYGQTSSGKTYTMTGITEYSVSEIYDYINKHPEREFVLKFSAIEIYNEAVKDLLNPDSGQLRLLDDPEKGTVVEKLTEETLRDQGHLRELLSFCEAQRQIGETSLNEMSSRSHQILRLSIESSARKISSRDNFSTLTATVNFVDLAGSERASQAHTAGSRLKEGCHINRSLLTLGTVIRKLSKGRNGHVPYRDSKLTRILQSSLGGNARTAIICTMSPARSHIEQSRNTLQFASCAKEVVTSARVNVVMSDKALVRHLRKELARLENELRYMGTASITSDSDVLKEKEAQIKKMEKEMKELMKQRDLAQSRLEDLLRTVGDDQPSEQWEELSQSSMHHVSNSHKHKLSISNMSGAVYQIPECAIEMCDESPVLGDCTKYNLQNYGKPEEQHAHSPLYHSTSAPTLSEQEETSSLTSLDYEDHFKKVRDIEMIEPCLNKIEDFDLLLNEEIDSLLPLTITTKGHFDREPRTKGEEDLKNESSQLLTEKSKGQTGLRHEPTRLPPPARDSSISRRPVLIRSRSCRGTLMETASSPWFEDVEEDKITPLNYILKGIPAGLGGLNKRIFAINYGAEEEKHSELSPSSYVLEQQNAKTSHDGSITRISNSVGQLEEMIHIQNQKEFAADQETKYTANGDSEMKITIKDVCLKPALRSPESPSRWKMEFLKKQQEIVELWHECNVSLVHRSYFFLLIKGDPTDSTYMEVEHRRLSFIRSSSSQGDLNKTTADDNVHDLTLKKLRREREKLSRLMNRLPVAERESLYNKWGIALDSKQRRMKLAHRVWTETKNMDHVRESAMLVAKLFGFLEPGLVPKEMFALSFTPQLSSRKSFNWKYGTSSHL
ncbi:kinesin-like protein KIN-7F isoform X2 [Asparagus officinalis]|uniref:kinesin-like protein KIN-7F isoform X2 n=1 Tax=Asparagus officinalis TaxID=4686 RepID=UPI00098DF544|nr:kinesin-like protein KIN-7F isoform X2 [Asparagus officinalis]